MAFFMIQEMKRLKGLSDHGGDDLEVIKNQYHESLLASQDENEFDPYRT